MAVLATGLVSRTAAAQEEPPVVEPPVETVAQVPPPPPPPPPASPPPSIRRSRLGDPGVVFLSAYSGLGISTVQYSGESKAQSFDATFSPGFDIYFWKHVSLGLEGTVGYSFDEGYSGSDRVAIGTTTLSGGVRVGVAIPLADRLFLVPRAAVGVEAYFVHLDAVISPFPIGPSGMLSTNAGPSASDGSTSGAYVSLFVPFVFRLAPGFYAGFGPRVAHSFLDHALTSFGPGTAISGAALLGTTFGGGTEFASVEEYVEHETVRFGARHQVVVTGAFGAGLTARFDQIGSRDTVSASLSPSADYFVAPSISVGLAPRASYFHAKDPVFAGGATERTQTTYAVDARVGWAIEASERFTVWPRIGAGVQRTYEERLSPNGSNHTNYTSFRVEADVPVLFHFSRHGFVGAAPRVSRELVRSYEIDGNDALQTRLALEFLAGGWF